MKFKNRWGFSDETTEVDFVEEYVVGHPDHGSGELENMRNEIDKLTKITSRIFAKLPPDVIRDIVRDDGYEEIPDGE